MLGDPDPTEDGDAIDGTDACTFEGVSSLSTSPGVRLPGVPPDDKPTTSADPPAPMDSEEEPAERATGGTLDDGVVSVIGIGDVVDEDHVAALFADTADGGDASPLDSIPPPVERAMEALAWAMAARAALAAACADLDSGELLGTL
ncbi:hypothetical protein HDU93_000414 [Gonapodya sp. JEL0774]|nr:hypothetical protein HDU93_000414 [Gonapodya sp. JEL0774]